MLEQQGAPPLPRQVDQLIFVYKAEAGKVNALIDSAKKLLGADGCSLCEITHGLVGEKNEWRGCREQMEVPVVAYHQDEMPSSVERLVRDSLPSVVAQVGGEMRILMDPEALEKCRGSVADFKIHLRQSLVTNGMVIPGFERGT